jgi:hypothetical protein
MGRRLLLGASISCAFAAAALRSAGSAHATCLSVNGIGNGGGCTSTPTSFAVALGPDSTASAQGLFNSAISVGVDAKTTSTGVGNFAAAVGNPGVNGSVMTVVPTDAVAKGTFNRAIAVGNGSGSAAIGTNNRAFLLGNGNDAIGPAASLHRLRRARTTPPSRWATSAVHRRLATTNSLGSSAITRPK